MIAERPLSRIGRHLIEVLAVGLLVVAGVTGAQIAAAGVGHDTSTFAPNQAQLASSADGRALTVARGRPRFGFNAKGPKDVAVQTARAGDLLGRIPAPTRRELVIRVTGGTISQTTSGTDWTDAMIGYWTRLQRKYGIRFVFVVNGNESPVGQAALIERWLDAGARFDFIEMMNEYYLPRFRTGDRSRPGVTRVVTPESYVGTILPAYWRELDRFRLPYYLIFAPTKTGTSVGQEDEHWNSVVAKAVNKTYRNRDLNATLHLYVRGTGPLGSYDYGQIDRLRGTLPSGRHIAVTEAGVIEPTLGGQELGRLAVTHYRSILRRLRAGDYLLDQVLFDTSPRNNTANLNRNGITPKGTAVLEFIEGGMR